METVDNIIKKNTEFQNFGSKAYGWAPNSVAELLENSMLEWQVNLSICLKIWVDKGDAMSDGELILVWVNLGSLLEGSMKFFLCVYLEDYNKEIKKIMKYQKEVQPDGAMLNQLINFFSDKKLFATLNEEFFSKSDTEYVGEYGDLFDRVRRNRNAIHSFRKRDIGDYASFHNSLEEYSRFLDDLDSRLPDLPN